MFSHIHGPDCKCGTGVGGGAGVGADAYLSSYMRSAMASPRAPRKPAATTAGEAFPVAPTPAFVSPFLEAQEMATRNVLAQIHPDVGISRSALTLLMRLQDALAHYLLWRAYRGENPPHRPGRAADGSRTQPQIDHDEQHAEALAAQMADPSHAIHFLFPEHVYAPELSRHANSERSKAMLKLLNGQIVIGGNAAADFFQFGTALSARWFGDFQTGVEQGPQGEEAKAAARRAMKAREEAAEKRKKKNTGLGSAAAKKKKAAAAAAAAEADSTAAPDAASTSSSSSSSAASAAAPSSAAPSDESKESKESAQSASAASALSSSSDPLSTKGGSLVLLPEVLQQPMEQVSLCAMVEYLTAELLELAGNRTLDAAQIHLNHANIQPVDLWQSIVTDEELRDLVRFLNVSWKTRGMEDLESVYHASLVAPDAPAVSFGLPPISFLLEEEFAASLEAQREVNEGSWYMQPKRVDSFARLFARGEMRLSPMERSLMELKVRPLRFYGRDVTTLLTQPPPMPTEDGAQPHPEPVSFVSVGITDGADREWVFNLELSLPAWRGCIRELQQSGTPIGYIERRMIPVQSGVSRPLGPSSVDTMRVDLAMCAAITDASGNSYTPRVNAMSELEKDIVAQITALKLKLDQHREATQLGSVAARTQAIEGVTPNVERVVEALVDAVETAAEMEKKDSSDAAGASSPSAPAASPSPPPTSSAEEVFDPFAVMSMPGPAKQQATSVSSSAKSFVANAAAAASNVAAAAASAIGGMFSPSAAAADTPKRTGSRGASAPTSSSSGNSGPASSSRGASATASTAASAAPVLSLGSTSRLSSLSGLLGGISSHIVTSQVQSELEQTISRILHLACWSRYGPTLYTANHPASARRAFTVALLDEAMQIAEVGEIEGDYSATAAQASVSASTSASVSASALPPSHPPQRLPQMPIVLLDLIAQFHSFDLPFLPDQAASQLKSAGWLALPPNRAGYPGALMNPVEKANQVTSGADEILEPVELEEGMEGEDDEEEDEEGEDEDEEDEEN